MNKKHSRRVSARKLRNLLGQLADELCSAQEKMNVALAGDTFIIHLEGASVNITINQEGGRYE